VPIYEYECLECGEKFELRRAIADSDSEVKCPKCGDEHPRKVFSAFGIASSNQICAPSSPT